MTRTHRSGAVRISRTKTTNHSDIVAKRMVFVCVVVKCLVHWLAGGRFRLHTTSLLLSALTGTSFPR